MEIEKESQLVFMDIMIRKNVDGTFANTVHRRKAYINRYLKAHTLIQKNYI